MNNTQTTASAAAVWTDFGPEWQVAYWARKCGVSGEELVSVVEPVCLHDIPVAEWVDRCAVRLGTLRPFMSSVQALARAIELHEERFHMRPEHAAELEFSDWPSLC
jgi:hypothetical protein